MKNYYFSNNNKKIKNQFLQVSPPIEREPFTFTAQWISIYCTSKRLLSTFLLFLLTSFLLILGSITLGIQLFGCSVFLHLFIIWYNFMVSVLPRIEWNFSILIYFCDRLSYWQWRNLKIWRFLFLRKAPLKKN